MFLVISKALMAAMLLSQSPGTGQKPAIPDVEKDTKPVPTTATRSDVAQSDEPNLDEKLLHVRRVFVESFGDDPISRQVQAMVISSLTESKKFIVTENKDKADAILKGSSLEKTSQELHSSSEATAAGGAVGGHSASVSGTVVNGTGSVSGSSHGGFVSRNMAIEDSNTSTETVNDARIAVRLVDPDGDVIWATTQESKGAKYKGATADVAEKVVKQLLHDLEKAQRKSVPN